MKLKKINPNLQKALIEQDFIEANEMQEATFSTLKSGVDAIISAPKNSGKSATIALITIQRLEKALGESTRALIIVEDKPEVLAMVELLEKLSNYMDLRVYGVHEKGDIDYDKNQISMGCDILVGTPKRLNDMFSSAGFNMNTIKMLVVDKADDLFKKRADAVVLRLSNSVEKTQRIFFCEKITDRIDAMSEKIMIEPTIFEFD